MKKTSNYKKDLYRYYQGKKPPFLNQIIKPFEVRYIKWYRICQSHPKNFFTKLMLRNISKKTHIQIPPQVSIGPGFKIVHFGHIVINHYVKIGTNFTVCPGVVLGQEERGERRGVPILGDCVYIGSNSVVVGNVKIGNDVLIAPNAFVNFDVPDHSVVIGNPGRIHHRDKSTEYYIKNCISSD